MVTPSRLVLLLVGTVAVLLSACSVQAGTVPTLSASCLADRTQGCCPGHIALLELEAAGCDLADVLQAASDADATTACNACKEKFDAIALAYGQQSGEGCLVVQQAVSMFPFACSTHKDVPCISIVKRVLNSLSDPANIPTADLNDVCETGGCWGQYMIHMRRSGYSITGASVASYKERVGGDNAMLTCLEVDGEKCLPLLPAFEAAMPTYPATLEAFDTNQDTTAFCSGCGRALLSNKLGLLAGSTSNGDSYNEGLRRYFLGSCAGGCTSTYLSGMPAGRRDYLDVEWQYCEALYSRTNPVCSETTAANCKAFVQDVDDAFGCCSRFALESAALAISDRTNSLPSGGRFDIPWYMQASKDSCSIDLGSGCNSKDSGCANVDATATCARDHDPNGSFEEIQPNDTFTATSDLGNVDVSTFDEDSELAKREEFEYTFRKDVSAAIGALPESITVEKITFGDDDTVTWSLKERTVAATKAAGEAYTSLINGGGMLLPSIGGFLDAYSDIAGVGNACPDDVIPNYTYIPGVGTVTTDCSALKTARENTNGGFVDCSAPVEDAFGNKYWVVSTANLIPNAQPC